MSKLMSTDNFKYFVSCKLDLILMDRSRQRLEGREERLRALAPPEEAGVLLTYAAPVLRPPFPPIDFQGHFKSSSSVRSEKLPST